MPLFKNKYAHVKIWRPAGAPFAEGTAISAEPGHVNIGQYARGILVTCAMDEAVRNFVTEFGREPQWNLCVMETTFGDNSLSVTIIELPEEE